MANSVWDLLLPEISKNLVQNPIFGTLASGWGTVNGVLAADTTAANILFGNQCGHYTGTTLPANSGIYANIDTAPSATTYVSVWIKGSAPAKLGVYVGGGWTYKTSLTTLETLANGYTRYGASFTAGEAATATYAGAFWAGTTDACIGGIQCEQSSTYTTQVHGDAGPGYVWSGAAHQSSSTRYILDPDGKVVYGGSITAVDDRVNVICEGMVGAGLLPYGIESLSLAGETPALFVGHDLKPRDIQLSLVFNATSLATSHTRRAALLALLPYGREVWLRYNGANSTLQIRAAVSGQFDLDLSQEPLGRHTVIAFTALDPKFQYIYADTTALTLTSSPSSSYARMRTDAAGWAAMSSGLFAVPRRAIQAPDGTIYVGTLASGGSAKLQKWTGSAWADVGGAYTGSITAGPLIYDLVPNADWTVLYVLGDYTTVGGTSGFGGVAAITLSSGAAAKLGTGAAGGAPLCGCYIKSLSRLYVGGLHATNMGGVANTSYFCYWDGAAWQSVGATRPTAGVYCMVNDGSDNLILGGDFTNPFALATSASPTVTLQSGINALLDSGYEYTVFIIPCDGTNFSFSQVSGRNGQFAQGIGACGPAQRQHFTPSGTNRQALISWTAVPGAKYYIIWIGTASYGDGLSLTAGPEGGANTTNLIDAFGRGNLNGGGTNISAWSNVNGSISLESTVGNSRYGSSCLKFTGTSLAAHSGPTLSLSSGLMTPSSYTMGAWVKGAVPDNLGWQSGTTWTYLTTTAQITDGSWVYYTATPGAAQPAKMGVFFSGTVTAYVGYCGISAASASQHVPYVKYVAVMASVVPASMTSAFTSQLTAYSSPDVPIWNWNISNTTRPIVDDYYFDEGTGSWGSRIVKHHPSDGSWERMAQAGGGFNGIVRALAWVNGSLVAGGDFTQVDNATANRVAYTRGKAWLPLGASGMPAGSVYRLAYHNGTLWAVGSFASADGDTSATLLARLDGFPGGGWTHADVALTNSSNNAYDVLPGPYRVAVFDDTTYSSAAGGTSIAYSGTGNLYPRIVVTGPGLLRWIENGLTKARIILNYTLQAGEMLVIDCDKATVTSNMYGDVTDQLAASSNLDGFYLTASSTQTVWCHMTGTTAASSVTIQGARALITGDV